MISFKGASIVLHFSDLLCQMGHNANWNEKQNHHCKSDQITFQYVLIENRQVYNRLSICLTIRFFQSVKSPAIIRLLASRTNHK